MIFKFRTCYSWWLVYCYNNTRCTFCGRVSVRYTCCIQPSAVNNFRAWRIASGDKNVCCCGREKNRFCEEQDCHEWWCSSVFGSVTKHRRRTASNNQVVVLVLYVLDATVGWCRTQEGGGPVAGPAKLTTHSAVRRLKDRQQHNSLCRHSRQSVIRSTSAQVQRGTNRSRSRRSLYTKCYLSEAWFLLISVFKTVNLGLAFFSLLSTAIQYCRRCYGKLL